MACCHCGHLTVRHSSPDTVFGGSDLDTRPCSHPPPEPVYRCLQCGYCAYDLSDSLPGIADVLASAEYQAALTNDVYPESSQNYFCAALLHEHANQLVEAGWLYVSLAWVSDDAKAFDRAQTSRLQAVTCFEKAIASAQTLSQIPGADALFLSDLLRRASSFARALVYCDLGLAVVEDKTIRSLLHYEKTLIGTHDSRCHTRVISQVSCSPVSMSLPT